MEQARYWMWTKRKHDMGTDFNDHVISSSSHVHPSVTVAAAAAATAASFGDSWEEQAFAEDAAGSLGGCIWPPRSYSCSFCRREFKSAQALGGHMNVHRRDRARLKQSPPNQEREREREGEKVLQNHHHHNFLNYNPQICTYLYKRSSDDSSSSPPPLPLPPPPPPSIRVSALPPPDHDKTAPFLTSIIINPDDDDDDDDDDDRKKHVTPEQSWSNFVSDKKKKKKSSSSTKSSSESNLSVSLNLLLCRAQIRNASAIDGDKETTCQTSKRRRLIDASSFTLFPKSSEMVLKNIPSSSMEDLDLELRLGDPPKVK